MALFSRESLDQLKYKIDLIEVLKGYIDLKPAGGSYKGLCPFHDEKSPSFVVQRGSSHYHCFGCGAHGDAISFLTSHLHLSFSEAVESLAGRFGVTLERLEKDEQEGNRKKLVEAHQLATKAYQTILLDSQMGSEALEYLKRRGIGREMIERFGIGLAPPLPHFLERFLTKEGFSKSILKEGGLLLEPPQGKMRDFFVDRITFPIQNTAGAIVGFSGRQYREPFFGGKYINTPETPIFKKSQVLFGLFHSRKRIAKGKIALLVEGQLDALRLIHEGLDITAASLGTAFGVSHVKELLRLGVKEVFLAFDGDKAGHEAIKKVGNLFQEEGVEVWVPRLPKGEDPDSYVKNFGIGPFLNLLEDRRDYLSFLYEKAGENFDLKSPATKNQVVKEIADQIRGWNSPLMVHESLKKLASIAEVSENLLGVTGEIMAPFKYKRLEPLGGLSVDPDLILEGDLIHWLFKIERVDWLAIAFEHLKEQHFRHPLTRRIFQELKRKEKVSFSLLDVAYLIEDEEDERKFSEILNRKLNVERVKEFFPLTIKKLLDREWMFEREEIREKIQSGRLSDEEAMELAKAFESLKKAPPQLPRLSDG